MNKNSKPPIQFTELNQDDILKHKDSYACLLINDNRETPSEKGTELHEAIQLFYEAFK